MAEGELPDAIEDAVSRRRLPFRNWELILKMNEVVGNMDIFVPLITVFGVA